MSGKKKAFTLIELLVVISIIALLIGILLPALGAARRTSRRMADGTQQRGIGQSLALYGSENQDALPTGTVLERSNKLLSFVDLDFKLLHSSLDSFGTATVPTGKPVRNTDISYALLATTSERWKNETSASVPFISNRSLAGTATAPTPTGSIFTDKSTDAWQGNIGWGDNHVSYEPDHTVATILNTVDGIFHSSDMYMSNPF